MLAIQATAAAAANTLANELTAAEATVTHATAQKGLAHSISLQAQTIAEEAARGCEQARMALKEAHCARATVIDPIEIAQADEQVEIAEVTLCERTGLRPRKGTLPMARMRSMTGHAKNMMQRLRHWQIFMRK
jgi:hypothetical protein